MNLESCSSDDSKEGPGQEIKDDKPVAADDTLTVEENSAAGTVNQVTVSENDDLGDDGGSTDNYELLTDPSNGTVTEISDGVFEYIPNTNFFGDDSFTYELSDKDGDTDSATVKITVTEYEPPASAFNNLNPDFPSFVSVENTTPADKKWVKQEAMSDEFDAWDGSKWFKSTWHYNVPVFMTTDNSNSGVNDGKLWIKATLNESNANGRWFQTARIHSRTKIKYPMYTEARIKTAHISAFNTYWLNNGNSANRDEIDIIENNSKPTCTNCAADDYPNKMKSHYHQTDENEVPNWIRHGGDFYREDLSSTNPLRDKGWNEEYHIYGAWWKDSKNVQFYLDGEPAGSIVVGEHWDDNTYDREFTRDLEIIFDLWTNEADWLGGLPPKSDLDDDSINTMRIDWVRTWELEDE
ncbi:Ig-like domain-containing protein [uncultured Algibacter sp.]|uniref:Ig-like domain-containing protein n=1 Tax=uncultured Algibacter sp. TaxID=298659 RepID=UPI0026030821|nr:Ig-like domain-containing protein [uncultured Algibacter sp.]